MSSPFSARSRWASWCCLSVISIATVFFLGRDSNSGHRRSNEPIRTVLADDEVNLAPTLVNAHELQPIASPNAPSTQSASTPQWNPSPQWRTVLTSQSGLDPSQGIVESIPRPPIPESFPLAPRFKNDPPTGGDALANGFPSRAPSAASGFQSMQPISPFLAKPVFPSAPSSLAQTSISPPKLESTRSQPAWPDQSFTVQSNPQSMNKPSIELPTPHLLTGAVVRGLEPAGKENAPSPITNRPSKPASSPRSSNYILQPMKNP